MEGDLTVHTYILIIVADFTFGVTYSRLNGDVTLAPAVRDTFEEILWKHNNDKVIELVRGQGIREFGKLRGRTTLNQETGELRVRNLEKRHSGRYTAEVLVEKRLQYFTFNVTVIDAVTRPTVQCEQRDSVGILRCHSEGEMGQYRWEGPNDFLMSWTEQPIGLEISRDQSSDSAYTCVVKNPVSEKSSEAFLAERCFKGHSSHGSGAVIAAAAVVTAAFIATVSGLIIGVHCVRRRDALTELRLNEKTKIFEEMNTVTMSPSNVMDENKMLQQKSPKSAADEMEGVGEEDEEAKLLQRSEVTQCSLWSEVSGEEKRKMFERNSKYVCSPNKVIDEDMRLEPNEQDTVTNENKDVEEEEEAEGQHVKGTAGPAEDCGASASLLEVQGEKLEMAGTP
ncbi:uncharacterized protein LOC108926879 isoform X2 [Scleropages formosus]|uniref:Spindle pole body component 110-like n=1 Tax=Scleropages formosus TaxID=113540 RepID=A0A8C9TCZ6_SCLFO|nr:uncharacterized protein LOC108926879 isoform X2 [Scleropages formosus]